MEFIHGLSKKNISEVATITQKSWDDHSPNITMHAWFSSACLGSERQCGAAVKGVALEGTLSSIT